MLLRTEPFHELDRWAQQMLGTATRPAGMPMDAWREADSFVVELDLPGVDPSTVELDVERNVLTVRAERATRTGENVNMLVAERPRGVFSRQLILGDALDTDRVEADYRAGVLRLTIPVAERAKPRKIEIASDAADRKAISV